MVRRFLFGVVLLAVLAVPSTGLAQGAQDGRLIVTVVDTSGAVVPGAKVTVSALDDGARAATFRARDVHRQGHRDASTGSCPAATASRRNSPGSRSACCRKCGCAAGDNKHVLVLPLKKMEESVTVAQNAQAAAADPRGNAFKTVLTPPGDREPVRRSGRDGAAAPGSRRRQRHHPRRQLRRRAAAAQGADQVDPHRPRRVRGGEPFRGVRRDRHHHPAGQRRAERRVQLAAARRRAERAQPVRLARKAPSARRASKATSAAR